jgi:hypothetical protein
MLQKEAKAAAGDGLQDSQNCLAGILRAANLGGSQVPVEMSLGRRMSGAKRTSRLRFSSAHRAADRQYMSQREFRGFHTDIIRHREFKRWSILLFGSSTDPKTGIYLNRVSLPGCSATEIQTMRTRPSSRSGAASIVRTFKVRHDHPAWPAPPTAHGTRQRAG